MPNYIRGLQKEDNFEFEKEALGRKDDPFDGELFPKDADGLRSVKSMVKEKISSTTRYNEGQRFYYSPVGYVFSILDEKKVIANFKGDGNVGSFNLPVKYANGKRVLQHIAEAMLGDTDILSAVNATGFLSKFQECAVRQDPNDETIASDDEAILYVMQELISSEDVSVENKTKLKNMIKDVIESELPKYYKEKGMKERYCGAGFNVDEAFTQTEERYRKASVGEEVVIGKRKVEGSDTVVQDEGKYTESIVSTTGANLAYVYANIDPTPVLYGALNTESPGWVIAEPTQATTAIESRLSSMLKLYNELKPLNANLEYAILDSKGVLHHTSEREVILALRGIIRAGAADWLAQAEGLLKQSFTRDAPVVKSISEAAVWEEDAAHGEITVIKPPSFVAVEASEPPVADTAERTRETRAKIEELKQRELHQDERSEKNPAAP